MRKFFVVSLSFLFVFTTSFAELQDLFVPEQLHLALGETPDQMVAIWVTPQSLPPSQTSVCLVGTVPNRYDMVFGALDYSYRDGGFKGQLHKATFKGLKAGIKHYYRCGSQGQVLSSNEERKLKLASRSEEYSFHTQDPSDYFVAAVIGDHGVTNAEGTFANLRNDTKAGLLDIILHVGDISYADEYIPHSTNSRIEDEYFRRMEPIAAYAPLMTSPGNHESQYAFAAYLNRTYMPTSSSGSRFWYSFDYGKAHFVVFSTEHAFDPTSAQYKWILQDLKKANQRRSVTPWLIVWAHRPLYCSALIEAERCVVEGPRYKKWLEKVFHENQVDIYFSGHNHNYERSFPVYMDKASNLSEHEYQSPIDTIYIVDGSAGNLEYIDPTWIPSVSWRAYHSYGFTFGFGYLNISATTLSWKFYDNNRNKQNPLLDYFTITKK